MTPHVFPLARLGRAKDTEFVLEPDAEARKTIADALALRGLKKLRFTGRLSAVGKYDWQLDARLGATAVQECVVTLEPVTTRVDVDVARSYLADMPEPTVEDFEIPEDDTMEPLPQALDLMDVVTEALALALPDYPRAEGVELGEAVFAAPGVKPMTDEDAKPLAGLGALRDKLSGGQNDPENDA
ncbi:YceD family protein [Gymnodinialimonas sp.]